MKFPYNPLWFPAVKSGSLWARIADRQELVHSREGEVLAREGDYICRGVEDELWPQSAAAFLRKYERVDPADGGDREWREYRPKPDACEVMAARLDRPIVIPTPQGELTGRAGDYLVRSACDDADVWIVAASIFEATYDRKG